jgi:Fur family peroxide stress response transcriptional regulator
MTRATRQRRIDELEQACREHGLPVTVQRRAVFEAILDRENHPTADGIYDQIKEQVPGISRTTVYRILDTFVQLRLITRICHHSSSARFDPKIHRHHHLVCSHCDTIIDLDDKAVSKVKMPHVKAHGFEVDDYYVHFHGICAKCRAQTKKTGKNTQSRDK